MKSKKVLVVCKNEGDAKEAKMLHFLDKLGFESIYAWKNNLSKKHIEDVDFVISIGGDGTALSASHYLKDKPLLAVNSSPKTSVGALTTLGINELPKKLNLLKNEDYKKELLERIEVIINNNPIGELALNDVFIASEKAYLISKYKIKSKSKEETQLSSGLIFSTGTGSTAWFNSAGGSPFSPQSKFIRMIVREPYNSKIISSSVTNSEIKEGEEFEVVPLVPSVLAVDSIREYLLNPSDSVKIRISSNPLKRII